MTQRDSAAGRRSHTFRHVAVGAAVAVSLTVWSIDGRAAGPFDTTDPAYMARAAKLVADGKIDKVCLPSAASAPNPAYSAIAAPSDALVAAASQEGRLILNSGISDTTTVVAYQAAFELRYPKIRMTVAAGSSAALEERFLADHAAGNQQADGGITNKLAWVERAFKEKALEPLDRTIPGFFDKWPGGSWRWETPAGATAPAFYRSLGIAYNSDLVKGNLIPKEFKDLANPAFKGQLLGLDPSASATYERVWKHIMDTVGEATMRAIGDNLIKKPLYTDVQPAAQALGAGAGMVLMEMGANVGASMRADGAPVEVVMPETTTGTQYAFGVAAKAPHPNAAKLFAHWLYSAEGQWVFSCSALAGTVAYPGYGSKTFVPIESVSKADVAKIRQLLGL